MGVTLQWTCLSSRILLVALCWSKTGLSSGLMITSSITGMVQIETVSCDWSMVFKGNYQPVIVPIDNPIHPIGSDAKNWPLIFPEWFKPFNFYSSFFIIWETNKKRNYGIMICKAFGNGSTMCTCDLSSYFSPLPTEGTVWFPIPMRNTDSFPR